MERKQHSGELFNMATNEAEAVHTVVSLGDAAIGTIEPEARNIDSRLVDAFIEELLTDRFYAPAEANVPVACVDGRYDPNANQHLPCAAGGTHSLFVADFLTNERYRIPGDKPFSDYVDSFCHTLQNLGMPIGDHVDNLTDAQSGKAGCGACDNSNKIMTVMSSNGPSLKVAAKQMGLFFSNEQHEHIIDKATEISDKE